MSKAPCINADQSQMQEAHTHHQREAGSPYYIGLPLENQGGIVMTKERKMQLAEDIITGIVCSEV